MKQFLLMLALVLVVFTGYATSGIEYGDITKNGQVTRNQLISDSFRNALSFFSEEDCDLDLTIVESSLHINNPTCPERQFSISFEVANLGNTPFSGNLDISFYNGDPQQPGAIYLEKTDVALAGLGMGDVMPIDGVLLTGPGASFDLYIVINDNGTTLPTPVALPNANIEECDYDNNMVSGPVVQVPFSVTVISTDDFFCTGRKSAPNGSARAFIDVDGEENTIDYDFYWFNGTSVTALTDADYIGPIYTGLSDGNYSVFATHKTSQCSSDTSTIALLHKEPIWFDVTIEVVSDVTICSKNNGHLRAIVNGGENPDNFTFEWYEGSHVRLSPKLSINQDLMNLKPDKAYSLVVTDKKTGCVVLKVGSVRDMTVRPEPTATATNDGTSDEGPGEVSVHVGGVTSGYTFEWYRGQTVKPSVDFTGFEKSGLSEGFYTVVAVDDITGCTSWPVTVEVGDQTVSKPIIGLVSFANPTQCLQRNTSGELVAAVLVNGVWVIDGEFRDTFDFEWFDGNVPNPVAGNGFATTSTVSGLEVGEYTVLVTDVTTGATAFEVYELQLDVKPVHLTASTAPLIKCDASGGSAVAFVISDKNDPSDYDYIWTMEGAPDEPIYGPYPYLEDQPVGRYTVMAIDRDDETCQSALETVEIEDHRKLIDVTIEPKALNTNCIDAVGNGVAHATVDGTFMGYTFDWFDTQGAVPEMVGSGPEVSVLQGEVTYSVKATSDLTACTGEATFSLETTLKDQVATIIEVLNDQTNCDTDELGFNGKLSAFVLEGDDVENRQDYIFTWYAGEEVILDTLSTGEIISNQPAGMYTVRAMSRITGCFADATMEIINSKAVIIVDGLVLTASEGSRYQWYKEGVALDETGKVLVVTETGDYSVEVFDENDCGTISKSVAVVVTSLIENNNEVGFKVSPNPNKGWFEVLLKKQAVRHAQITIVSAEGKIIEQKELKPDLNGSIQVDISTKVPGFYWVIIQVDGKAYVEKVSKH